MSGTDKHTSVKASYTAAEQYRQTADEHVRTLKDFWKDFLVSGLFVLAAIVIIFACLAWFAANNSVSATGSTISAKGARYTLTAEGEGKTGAHKGVYDDPTMVSFDLRDSMTITEGSNLNNNDVRDGIYPGARGVLKFTVTPLTKDLQGIQIDLSRILQTKTSGTIPQANAGLTEEQTVLLNLFKTHLLFFGNMDANGFYSNRVDSKIYIAKGEFCEDGSTETTKPVQVSLYWVWPEYLQNFVLTGNALYYKNLFASVNDDCTSLQKAINEGEKTSFYYGMTADGAGPDSTVNLSPDNMTAAQIATCAELYNNADEHLGASIEYLQLRISAQEVSR